MAPTFSEVLTQKPFRLCHAASQTCYGNDGSRAICGTALHSRQSTQRKFGFPAGGSLRLPSRRLPHINTRRLFPYLTRVAGHFQALRGADWSDSEHAPTRYLRKIGVETIFVTGFAIASLIPPPGSKQP